MRARSYPGNDATGYVWGTADDAVKATAYAAARADSDGCENRSISGDLEVGQWFLEVLGTWYARVERAYISFDTSVIGALPFTGACLFVYAWDEQSDNAGPDLSDILVYNYDSDADLCGANQEANYDGAYGVNATLEGTLLDTTGGSVEDLTWYDLEVATSNINVSGSTTYTMVCQADVDNDDSKDVGTLFFKHLSPEYPYLQLDVPGGFAWIF
jgi:hypothetical protein